MEALNGLLGSVSPVEAHPLVVAAGLLFTLVLSLVIGATYRHTHEGGNYVQSFVQTLVLVSMVASLVLSIVGENVAAAFAIFGAFSIIRYRSSVPETRDVGFIFFSMAVGLAVGAQLYWLALVATAVICPTIYCMWRFDLFAPERTSHLLRIRVTNDVDFATAFTPAFDTYLERVSPLRVESVQGGLLTELSYAVRLRPGASAHAFVSELQRIAGNNRVVLTASGSERSD